VSVRDRHLHWDGCLNVRDLGGHPTDGGRETRFGSLIRADSVRQLSEQGWNDVVAYGVRTVVDLRLHDELAADPPGDVPVQVVHVPVFAGAEADYWERIGVLSVDATSPVAATEAMYLDFLDSFQTGFAAAVSAVAVGSEGAVVVHCAVGKDRTGLVTALLLRLAGVSAADIAADYAVSEANLLPMTASWIAEALDDRERLLRQRLAASPAQAILTVLSELEERYGGAREYLLAGGASGVELDRVRARLRD
jgi:protein-tyrosine phosphatase